MTSPAIDQPSPGRRARDEQIAAEPLMPPLEVSTDVQAEPLEKHLAPFRRRPVAVAGIVDNGLVRPLDPLVKLPEHSRVIIVTSEAP